MTKERLLIKLSRTDPGTLLVKPGIELHTWVIYEKVPASGSQPLYYDGIDLMWASPFLAPHVYTHITLPVKGEIKRDIARNSIVLPLNLLIAYTLSF